MERIVAIDFETANQERNSMCQVGMAVIENKKIVKQKAWLVKPPIMKFHFVNINIHGITAKDVKDEPLFPEIWENVTPYFEDAIIVAHNMSFDKSVMNACLKFYGMKMPKKIFTMCTVKLSKKFFPDMKHHKLNLMCDRIGIELKHHDAYSDSIACGKLLLYFMEKYGVDNPMELLNVKVPS